MKKHQNLILPVSIFILLTASFLACRKEINRSSISGRYALGDVVITDYEWTFDTPNDPQGWTAGNATIAVSGGALNVTTTSTDPLLLSPDNLSITSPSANKYIRINMKNNTSTVTSARIFFTTAADTTWTQTKSKGFTITTSNTYYASYVIDMSTVPGWAGTIKRIRIDPLDPAGGSGQTVNIDYIGISQAINSIGDWGFDTDNNFEGWSWANASATVLGGTLNLIAGSSDPLLLSPDHLGITDPSIYKYVHVDMKNNSGVTSGRIFFITDADTSWTQAKSKSFAIKANTSYYGSNIVDMSTVTGWAGTIRQIRVDPIDGSGVAAGDSVKIDFIRITDNRSYRGVMSPQLGVTAGDMDTLNLWKANVMRWQINGINPPPAVSGYDTFLTREMGELDNAFRLCKSRGIKILIDMHYTPGGTNANGGWDIFYDQAANDKIVSAWQTLASRYKDSSALFGYDLINEPKETVVPNPDMNTRATEIRIGNAIRAIDRKTPILISYNPGELPFTYDTVTPLPLTNVIYAVHMYVPYDYTYQFLKNSGYNTAYTYPGFVLNGTTWDKSRVTAELAPVHTFQTTYNARIFVGEFSAVRWAGGAAAYLRDNIDLFESYGWSWTYHAYREDNAWSLEHADSPVGESGAVRQLNPPTDRWNQVAGYGMNLNQ